MWGQVDDIEDGDLTLGITPTHVGKSLQMTAVYSAERDHPHPCGEKYQPKPSSCEHLGSPPPMWGKV